MNDNFSELKERILASARSAQACREQYRHSTLYVERNDAGG